MGNHVKQKNTCRQLSCRFDASVGGGGLVNRTVAHIEMSVLRDKSVANGRTVINVMRSLANVSR